MEKITILPTQVLLITSWLIEREGVAVWETLDLSRAGSRMFSPVNNQDGTKVTKPRWDLANEPSFVVTNPEDVVVEVSKEVKRFRVALRQSGNGLSIKLTDHSSDRVSKECVKAKEKYFGNARYEFDYDTQEAVILVAEKTIPLVEHPDFIGAERKEVKAETT